MIFKYKPIIMQPWNKHPQLNNLTLRLTEEQRLDPILVINDFFECYHLNDVRELIWKWLVEILSSSGSFSSQAIERCNSIFFYEKIEMLIEACYLLRKQAIELSQNKSSGSLS
jgi:hypothetical protein